MKPTPPRISERRGRAKSISPGHNLSNVPIELAAPLRYGFDAQSTASTANTVGTTSNLASRIGPINNPEATHTQAGRVGQTPRNQRRRCFASHKSHSQ